MTKSSETDLLVRVAVLEKLVDKLLDDKGKADVASKTADKALQMAQEALALIISEKNNQNTNDKDPWDDGKPVVNGKNTEPDDLDGIIR